MRRTSTKIKCARAERRLALAGEQQDNLKAELETAIATFEVAHLMSSFLAFMLLNTEHNVIISWFIVLKISFPTSGWC
jgi:hypothetical protein